MHSFLPCASTLYFDNSLICLFISFVCFNGQIVIKRRTRRRSKIEEKKQFVAAVSMLLFYPSRSNQIICMHMALSVDQCQTSFRFTFYLLTVCLTACRFSSTGFSLLLRFFFIFFLLRLCKKMMNRHELRYFST